MNAANAPGTLCIRADADSRMGIGHVMRCIALAQAWQCAGGEVSFVTAADSPALLDRLALEGIKVTLLQAAPGSSADACELAHHAACNNATWVVLDGYHFGPEYRAIIKKADLKLIVIDDLADSDLSQADAILNQNHYATAELYKGLAGKTARLLVGVKYTLLRHEFTELRRLPSRAALPEIKTLLITLGGADAPNVTQRIMELLTSNPMQIKMHVVIIVGATNPHLNKLQAALPDLQKQHNAVLSINPPNMAELMRDADLAISASGSSTWELACLGVPMALIVTADNQREVARSLEKSHAALVLGEHPLFPQQDTFQKLHRLMFDQTSRSRMQIETRRMIDGDGAKRVVDRLVTHPLHLRLASFNDARLLFEWANDPLVRQMSFSADPISWENHIEWLNRCLGSDTFRFKIGLDDENRSIGLVRLNREGGIATLSISVAPEARGQGYASKLAKLASLEALNDNWCAEIHAWVKSENTASLKTFVRAGFTERKSHTTHPQQRTLFVMSKQVGNASTI
ncbi:MAG: UDP-2,4-diacetamido-2,4,6-trideoxy-beta-L-altropyranose hydrolase [Prosthecobacter sp.]